MAFSNFRPRVKNSIVTLITRQLTGKGQILVQVGQEVTPFDTIGQTQVSAGFRVINLSQELSVSGKEVAQFLVKQTGQNVFRGEVLALKPGFLGKKKPFLSPVDGVIESLDDNGNLRVAYLPEHHRLLSSVFGIVQKTDPKKGTVVIKVMATEILGVAGCGKIREGNLMLLGERGSVTNLSRIKPTLTDKIVVVGSFIYQDALRASVAIDVKGIVTGGMNASDFRSMTGGSLTKVKKFVSDVGISMLLTEGFGSWPIGEDIFEELLKHNGRFAVLDGERGRLILPSFEKDSMLKVRATALPSVENKPINQDLETMELKKGQSIRIIGSLFLGEEGKLFSIDSTPTLLPSGLSTYLLTIETKQRKIKVPLANVEIIA